MQINPQVFDKFPVLQTERLTLRDIRIEDARQIMTMRSNGMVNRFIPRPESIDEEAAKDLVSRTRAAYENQQGIGWAGVLRGKGEIIGTCGFNRIDTMHMRAEIGGELTTAYWGKHLALEAVKAIIQFGLYDMKLHSIEAKVAPQNRGAIAVLESLGFEKEGHFKECVYYKDQFLDTAVYSLIKGKEIL